ncbi:WD40 repeat domain-containing protein [Aspergillus undulatus]|uniref:WD40 repeat domain-containing protein n=1 Tax=Aspergillus undulatus TaxID=1810928 RepID=UPI003CCDD4C9
MAFSQDCQLLASGTSNGTVQVWDVLSGKRQWSFTAISESEADDEFEAFSDFAFSPDNQVLASLLGDLSITLWNTITGHQQQELPDHDEQVTCMAFSPDSKIFASGSLDKNVRLWNVAAGRLEQTLEGHETGIVAVAFAPDLDCPLLGSSSRDEIRLWNTATGQLHHVFSILENSSADLKFSSTGPFLDTANERFCIEEWYHKDTSEAANNDDPTTGSPFTRTPEHVLGRNDRWLCLEGKKLLYVPIEYQFYCAAVTSNIVALGDDSEVLFVSAP